MEQFVKPKLKDWSGSKLTTVNTYGTVPDALLNTAYFKVKGYKRKAIQLTAATKTLLYSIDVSMDASVWVNKTTDQELAAAASIVESLTELWNFLRVQVKPKDADQHGTLTVGVWGSTL